MKGRLRTRNGIGSILIWFVCAATLFSLFALFPYTTSHLSRVVTLAQAAWFMWHFSDFSHGMWVAPFSCVIVWMDRGRLAGLPCRGTAWGLAVLALGFFFYLLGYMADVQYFGFISFNVIVAGLILWLGGKAWMRALAFPWFFLFFMWPLPFLDNLLAFPLRMLMAQGSHFVLAFLGVGNVRVGTAILSAAQPGWPQGTRFAIDVADPCSGLRSLFALMMLAALFGHFVADRLWKQIVLFVAAVPLAVAGNMVRIVLLTYATLHWGADFAVGRLDQPTWFHMAAGYAVFLVALGGLFFLERVLHGKAEGKG